MQHRMFATLLVAPIMIGSAALAQDASPPPIVAVFLMESRGSPLSGDELVGLTDYMATRLGEQGKFQIIPRDEIKKRLAEQKSQSYKDCIDQACQIEIGRELAAQYTVTSSISKVGSRCLITAALYDLRKAATIKTASSKKSCLAEELITAVEGITDALQKVMIKGQKVVAEAKQPAPEPAPAPAPVLPPPATEWQVGSRPPAAAPPVEQYEPGAQPRTGWALGAGIAGLIGGAVGLGLAVGSTLAVPNDDSSESLALGAAATLTFAIMGPITFSGSRSTQTSGSVGLRVAGWITYGLCLVDALALLGYGLAFMDTDGGIDDTTMQVMVVSTGILGTLSLTLFSIDAFVAYGKGGQASVQASATESDGFRVAPVITPLLPPPGQPEVGAGLGLGVVGRF